MTILNVQAVKKAPEAEFNQIKTTKGNGNHILAKQQRMNDIMYHKNKASFIKGLKEIIHLQYMLDVHRELHKHRCTHKVCYQHLTAMPSTNKFTPSAKSPCLMRRLLLTRL